MFIWLNWSSKIYPGLAELGQQICDTSLEQRAHFSCTGSEAQHMYVEGWKGTLATYGRVSPGALCGMAIGTQEAHVLKSKPSEGLSFPLCQILTSAIRR